MTRIEHLAEGVTLYLGDMREVLPTLGRFDACVTDPPYGIARVWKGGFGHGWGRSREQADARNAWDEEAPSKETLDGLRALSTHQIIWGGNHFELPISRGWLVWNKPERGFSLAEAELAWTNVDTVIRVCDAPRSDVGRQHPTQKPLAVMLWSIDRVPKAQTIFDPFMGSGTTGVAAVKRGKAFVGVEREPAYFDLARRRIADALARPDLFVERPARMTQGALL
jgi:site-specific DNA-methyltransferase (adenine-specific)